MAEQENELYEHESKPDIDFLKSDFDRCRHNLSYYLDLAEEARDLSLIHISEPTRPY